MKNVKIERTNKSPEVILNPDSSSATFRGRSIHSDGFQFYDPIIRWFADYSNESIEIDFIFDHINTITNKCMLQILLDLKKKKEAGLDLKITWHFDPDDDDMLETGEELELLSNVKFEYKKFD